MATNIFIDGKDGTTGLRIFDRLAGRADVNLITLEESRRKDPAARQECIHAADVAILCLPDAAARESVALAQEKRVCGGFQHAFLLRKGRFQPGRLLQIPGKSSRGSDSRVREIRQNAACEAGGVRQQDDDQHQRQRGAEGAPQPSQQRFHSIPPSMTSRGTMA